MATERNNDLHDHFGRQQTPNGLGYWLGQPSSVVAVDRCGTSMGAASDEHRIVGDLRKEPPEVESLADFERAVWRA